MQSTLHIENGIYWDDLPTALEVNLTLHFRIIRQGGYGVQALLQRTFKPGILFQEITDGIDLIASVHR